VLSKRKMTSRIRIRCYFLNLRETHKCLKSFFFFFKVIFFEISVSKNTFWMGLHGFLPNSIVSPGVYSMWVLVKAPGGTQQDLVRNHGDPSFCFFQKVPLIWIEISPNSRPRYRCIYSILYVYDIGTSISSSFWFLEILV
jgi:hypothetical protein